MWIIAIVSLFIMTDGNFFAGYADEHEHDHKDKRHHHGEESHHQGERSGEMASLVVDPTYSEKCGTCHMAYPPFFLPEASWKKMMAERETHFGERVDLTPEELGRLSDYLSRNAAEKVKSDRSMKIMKPLAGKILSRITEIPYIVKKHDGLPPSTFQTKAVGSFGNCKACHAGAEQGEFDDDTVVIPN